MTVPILTLQPNRMKVPAIESVAIDRANLTIVEKYKSLKTVGTAGTLAVKIARESYFGQKVLAHCTVYGHREQSGLPRAELFQLKQTMFNLSLGTRGLLHNLRQFGMRASPALISATKDSARPCPLVTTNKSS